MLGVTVGQQPHTSKKVTLYVLSGNKVRKKLCSMYYLGTRWECRVESNEKRNTRDPLKKQEEGKYKIIGAKHQKVK
jgi:hypothetical protein